MSRILMRGNEAISEAAVLAGCKLFFGYPITPQNEIPEYMSKRMPQAGGVFIQAESEVSAINMVYGAACTGTRCMTSSSSPGISLKQEGISYCVGSQLPCVIVNIMRAGPGLGGIQPGQADYHQSTRGGGHGDYRMVVLAPDSIQEAMELTMKAFDIADQYRNPVLVAADGFLGSMMEAVEIPQYELPSNLPAKDWATTGWDGVSRPRNIINSLFLDPQKLEDHNLLLWKKFALMQQNEVRFQEEWMQDAEYAVVAYGVTARIVRSAVMAARQQGIKVGLVRPITLWPFPQQPIEQAIGRGVKAVLTVEMSMGQMLDDVRLVVQGRVPTPFYGRVGGMSPTTEEVFAEIIRMKEGTTHG